MLVYVDVLSAICLFDTEERQILPLYEQLGDEQSEEDFNLFWFNSNFPLEFL